MNNRHCLKTIWQSKVETSVSSDTTKLSGAPIWIICRIIMVGYRHIHYAKICTRTGFLLITTSCSLVTSSLYKATKISSTSCFLLDETDKKNILKRESCCCQEVVVTIVYGWLLCTSFTVPIWRACSFSIDELIQYYAWLYCCNYDPMKQSHINTLRVTLRGNNGSYNQWDVEIICTYHTCRIWGWLDFVGGRPVCDAWTHRGTLEHF